MSEAHAVGALAPVRSGPDPRKLVERIAVRNRIGLSDAMRLRDLGLAPFLGATVFVLDENDAVESVGCTAATTHVCVPSIIETLQRRIAS